MAYNARGEEDLRPLALGVAAAIVLAACAPAPLTPTPQLSATPFVLPTVARPTATRFPTTTPAPTVTVVLQPTPTPESAAGLALFEQAKSAAAERYQFAVKQGAQFLATADHKSFYVLWLPPGTSPGNPPPLIVTLHGHAAWAFDEFSLWQPYAVERGYGLLALQWWFGAGDADSDYYQPPEIYRNLSAALAQQNVLAGTVLFHGFSRGAANGYGVTALDRESGNNYFRLTVANAGGATEDFPINEDIAGGEFGPLPFAGTHWVLYCGRADPNPDRDGCPAMQGTRNWVTRFGGMVDLFLADSGGHGGFHQSKSNVNRALDAFAALLPQ